MPSSEWLTREPLWDLQVVTRPGDQSSLRPQEDSLSNRDVTRGRPNRNTPSNANRRVHAKGHCSRAAAGGL